MIYVMQAGATDAYKVGSADGVRGARTRRTTLQIGCPEQLKIVALFDGDIGLEKALHDQLAEWAIRGEWFRMSPVLADLVERFPFFEPPTVEGPERRCIIVLRPRMEMVRRMDAVRGEMSMTEFVEWLFDHVYGGVFIPGVRTSVGVQQDALFASGYAS